MNIYVVYILLFDKMVETFQQRQLKTVNLEAVNLSDQSETLLENIFWNGSYWQT